MLRGEYDEAAGIISADIILYFVLLRGEYDEAAGIISALEERKVQHGQSIYRAQVLGSAANGDIDRLKELIQIYAPGDQVMLQALGRT